MRYEREKQKGKMKTWQKEKQNKLRLKIYRF